MHTLSTLGGIPAQYGLPVDEEAKRIRVIPFHKLFKRVLKTCLTQPQGSYKCSKCGQPKKGHKCPQMAPEMSGGTHMYLYDMNVSYAHPQINHMLKTIAHLENSVKVHDCTRFVSNGNLDSPPT